MAEHETTADVIAWLRRPREGENGYLTAWRDEIADRLEAAHKRESGNCAELRNALNLCVDEMCARCRDLAKARGDTMPCLSGCEPVRKAKAALAAPPRNCDLARDWIRDLYAHFQPPASIKREMPPEWVDSVMAFCRWLLSPATEKEGGNNANE